MTGDLTTGKPVRVITVFALPMLAGNIFQQLYSMADSIIIGNFAGAESLAAVGASFAVNFLVISVAIGLTTGCSVAISQLFGAGRFGELRKAVFTSLVFLAGVAIAMSVIFFLLAKPLLVLLRTPENIMEESVIYLKVLFTGVLFSLIYNASAAILRALGDSRTPLRYLIIASVLNIILDLLFVIVFGWGVAGVAAATITAQGVSAVLGLYHIFRKMPDLKLTREDAVFDTDLLRKMLGYGVPATVQQLMVCLRMMVIQGLVNSFGSDSVAGFTISNRIEMLAMMPIMNIGMAYSTYTAQNIGAGNIDRVKKGLRATLLITILSSIVIGGMIILLRRQLVFLFLGEGAAAGILDFVLPCLKVLASLYFINAVMISLNGVLRGAGDMNAFMFSSMATLFSRIIAAYLLAPVIGVAAVWWSNPISWVIGLTISFIRYKGGRWQTKADKLLGKQ